MEKKTAKYTVQVTYTKDNTTDTADVWVDVAGGQSSGVTTDFNVKDNAALTADKAKAALSTASTTAIGKLANGKNVKYSWASDENGTALNVDTSDSDGKTAYVIIDYGDGTKQAVAVNIHVKSQKEQHSGKIKVNNDETNPIRTHVNANQNYGLDTSVAIDGLTEGKDYTLSWLGDAPDVTDANLTNGEKTAKYTVQVTYTKDNTTDTADVWVDVAGGQSSGVTTDFNVKDNAALTADKAKAALSTASTTAIGKLANGKNVKYSWASDENGTALNVDTSDSDGKTAYVIIDYGDGTKQAVAVNIHVKSQKEQHSGKIKVNNDETNPIRTHVNANQNYGLDTSVAIDGLTEGKDYTLSWLGDAPDVTDANLTNGEKDS
ncbi:Rib/alpha-like domain-containing protein [Lactobacillus sp. ESL0791]|uniref:Rib/alpha-like domain-containing protein n=1 Tax=Lactobacillus sp. ESL0791 TaxID=2983234 RepID=UPI0023F86EA4|nr:Rib/alpha-like domain-containing protein [Lactobacillus sp. ESL0791]MDF7639196.1 Rib/alpha-like domain-containing protein [Lactobacillus sp. ESL0791]